MPFECKERAARMRNIFYFVPLWTMVGLTTLVQCLLVWTVFRTVRRANKWRFGRQEERRSLLTSRATKRKEKKIRRQMASTKRVALQSFLYLASLDVAWMPWVVAATRNKNVENIFTDHSAFWFILSVAILQPLQGFLNCLAYFHTQIINRLACRCCKESERGPVSSKYSGARGGGSGVQNERWAISQEGDAESSVDTIETDFAASDLYDN